jgi:chromosome segregation ATPase
MVSTSSGKRPSSNDEKYSKIKRNLAEQDPGKKMMMLVEAIVDLLVSNDVSHAKMMESINYIRNDLQDFKTEITKRFEMMQSELDAIEAAIGVISTRADVIARHMQRVEDTVLDVDSRIGKLEIKAANLDDRIGDIDKKLAGHDQRFTDIDKKLDEILHILYERKQ